eukprot:Skav233765  [mRNA]  locus=scaffold2701:224140:228269:- [translate_table: standard]
MGRPLPSLPLPVLPLLVLLVPLLPVLQPVLPAGAFVHLADARSRPWQTRLRPADLDPNLAFAVESAHHGTMSAVE